MLWSSKMVVAGVLTLPLLLPVVLRADDWPQWRGLLWTHIYDVAYEDLLDTNKGELIRAQLTAESYKELSRIAVLEPTMPFSGRKVAWSPPVSANRHIFARSGKELVCASLEAKP